MPTDPLSANSLHEALVRFPSLSGQEADAADFVEATAQAAGLATGRHDDNVWCWLGEEDAPALLLNSHLDVVPPSQRHPFDPFMPTLHEGRLYGRGTVDAKASGAAMLAALLRLAHEGWTPPTGRRVLVALTTHEETGGAYNGLDDTRPHLGPLAAALVGEPTEMQPCVAQKGLLILKLVEHGRSAHAARSHLGQNALLALARDLLALDALTFDREDPHLGRPTLTPTTVQGGTARNVVPDRCEAYLDIRSTPAYSHPELVELVEHTIEGDVHVHSDRIVPVATPTDAAIVRACCDALPGATPFGSPTASDWIFLADVPTVKIGPGDSNRSHTAEESIRPEEVAEAAEAYAAIIKRYFAH